MSTELKRVIYHEWKKVKDKPHFVKVKQGEATFHAWGLDVLEGENGNSSYSVAILEIFSGTIITVEAQLVQFITE